MRYADPWDESLRLESLLEADLLGQRKGPTGFEPPEPLPRPPDRFQGAWDVHPRAAAVGRPVPHWLTIVR